MSNAQIIVLKKIPCMHLLTFSFSHHYHRSESNVHPSSYKFCHIPSDMTDEMDKDALLRMCQKHSCSKYCMRQRKHTRTDEDNHSRTGKAC